MRRRHRALFELLLRLFPAPFRKRFGNAMREAYSAAFHEHRVAGRVRLAGFLVRTTVDMSRSGLRERLRPTTEPERANGRWAGWHVSWLDVKLGLRMLVKHPGLTFVAVVALSPSEFPSA